MQFAQQSRRAQARTIDVDIQWALWAFLAGIAAGLVLHFL